MSDKNKFGYNKIKDKDEELSLDDALSLIPKAKYDFRFDLKFGEAREAEFMSFFGDNMTKGDGRTKDIILKDGDALELKSERYTSWNEPKDMDKANYPKIRKTKYLFVEFKCSNGKEVGPYKAHKDGVKFYAHFFMDGILYLFETEKLINWLKTTDLTKYKTFDVTNNGATGKWTCTGYLIDNWDVKHLCHVPPKGIYNYNKPYPDEDEKLLFHNKNYEKFFGIKMDNF